MCTDCNCCASRDTHQYIAPLSACSPVHTSYVDTTTATLHPSLHSQYTVIRAKRSSKKRCMCGKAACQLASSPSFDLACWVTLSSAIMRAPFNADSHPQDDLRWPILNKKVALVPKRATMHILGIYTWHLCYIRTATTAQPSTNPACYTHPILLPTTCRHPQKEYSRSDGAYMP